jgi:hypothetical protein
MSLILGRRLLDGPRLLGTESSMQRSLPGNLSCIYTGQVLAAKNARVGENARISENAKTPL